ncbi:MAG: hypothetical protein J6A15_08510 [Clostridia bacterium]|nr:hypothetical protein [Clostridia bacterium]
MTKEEFLLKVWNYYIILENRFINTFQYVEPNSSNNNTYSKEYNNLLLSIGSEIDIVAKELCKVIESKTSKEVEKYKITDYKRIISSYNNFVQERCNNIITIETITPWDDWNSIDSPFWWKNYNHLKHDRLQDSYFKLGNYNNVKYALSALYIICRVLYKSYNFSKEPTPKSNLFKMDKWDEYREIGNNLSEVSRADGSVGIYYTKD